MLDFGRGVLGTCLKRPPATEDGHRRTSSGSCRRGGRSRRLSIATPCVVRGQVGPVVAQVAVPRLHRLTSESRWSSSSRTRLSVSQAPRCRRPGGGRAAVGRSGGMTDATPLAARRRPLQALVGNVNPAGATHADLDRHGRVHVAAVAVVPDKDVLTGPNGKLEWILGGDPGQRYHYGRQGFLPLAGRHSGPADPSLQDAHGPEGIWAHEGGGRESGAGVQETGHRPESGAG